MSKFHLIFEHEINNLRNSNVNLLTHMNTNYEVFHNK